MLRNIKKKKACNFFIILFCSRYIIPQTNHPMKHSNLLLVLLAMLSGTLSSCERNDDEPLLPPTRISRLYVSFSNVQDDELADPYKNIAVFDPVNLAEIPEPEWFQSDVEGGAGIYFSPEIGKVIQGSVEDSTIRTFTVSSTGVLSTSTFYSDSTLGSQQAMVLDPVSGNLYLSDEQESRIAVFADGGIRSGNDGANKHLFLEGKPWGLARSEDSLFVALAGSAHRVLFIESVSKRDSGQLGSVPSIEVEGAADLRGIAFSKSLDLLVVTDVQNHCVYVFENAMGAFEQDTPVAPSYTIQGPQTTLQEPISIAIDPREEEMKLYVADRSSRKILRFKISDNGDTAPEAFYDFSQQGMTPVSIFLDAR